ncbi:MAG: biopolymer transporter ExbD [Calditrichota bacterium]
MKLIDKKKAKAVLNITPLIDVLFILIIFFTITSTFLEQPGLKLDLPKAATGELQKVEKAVLTIAGGSQMQFGDKDVTRTTLPEVLKTAMAERGDKSLIISADKKVEHGTVVEIMDIARQNGVEKLVISTENE